MESYILERGRECAREHGYEGAAAEIFAEEFVKGFLEERTRLIGNMLRNGMTPKEISQMCDIDIEEVKKVKEFYS